MREEIRYPNVAMLSPTERKNPERVAQVRLDRLRADRACAVRGTHRQKVKVLFRDAGLRDDAALWGDRGQRRAAERAKGLVARGYKAVP